MTKGNSNKGGGPNKPFNGFGAERAVGWKRGGGGGGGCHTQKAGTLGEIWWGKHIVTEAQVDCRLEVPTGGSPEGGRGKGVVKPKLEIPQHRCGLGGSSEVCAVRDPLFGQGQRLRGLVQKLKCLLPFVRFLKEARIGT